MSTTPVDLPQEEAHQQAETLLEQWELANTKAERAAVQQRVNLIIHSCSPGVQDRLWVITHPRRS